MIEDIRAALADGADIGFDLVVIGAGPAGITLARELAGTGLKIALLEAGGMEHPSAGEMALYEGNVSGLPYPLSASRQRFFGGTSNHWGGWCRPLDASDMAARDWIPRSGWPFGRETLDPWYGKAHGIVEIPVTDYDMSANASAETMLPLDEASGFRNSGFRFSPPTRFGPAYRESLKNQPDLSVFLKATVTAIHHHNGRVGSVGVRTLDGHAYTIRGERFVLATGGLEVPRMLLHTASGDKPALGDHGGWLGRCFMEHFGYRPGYLLTRQGLRYFRHEGRRAALMPVLAPRESLMRELKLNNACLQLKAVAPDTVWPGEALLTPGLAPALAETPWRYQVTMINEPSPNPDSRVTLSDERDALGFRRLDLHWAIRDQDLESVERLVSHLGRWLGRSGLGRLQFSRPVSEETTQRFGGGMHHMGTARMSREPGDGVVDPDCRVHGTDNLYVASGAVFPAVGYSNPTLTIVALALRLADHLRRNGT